MKDPRLFEPRLEILPAAQREVWPQLPSVSEGFVLYGDTAVALYFGHRSSVDFDFFSSRPLDPEQFKARHPLLASARTIQIAPNTLSVLSSLWVDEVKLSFFGGLPFGRVEMPSVCRDTFLQVASPLDLAVQKLKVIMVRSEVKDYLDLDCLLQNGVDLGRALGAAGALYPDFPTSVAARALCYFEDGDVPTLGGEEKQRLRLQVQKLRQVIPVARISHDLDIAPSVITQVLPSNQPAQ